MTVSNKGSGSKNVSGWICPRCQRHFRSRNQAHSCMITDISSHFINKNDKVWKTYECLMAVFPPKADIKITPVKNAIIISAKSTFLALKPKKEYLEIEFLLNQELDEFPVYKTFRVSKNKVAHFVKAGSPDDIEGRLIQLILSAFELNLR